MDGCDIVGIRTHDLPTIGQALFFIYKCWILVICMVKLWWPYYDDQVMREMNWTHVSDSAL